jgi:hypothetical protein
MVRRLKELDRRSIAKSWEDSALVCRLDGAHASHQRSISSEF